MAYTKEDITMDKHDKSENSGYKPSQEFMDHFKPLIVGAGTPPTIRQFQEKHIESLEQRVRRLEEELLSEIKLRHLREEEKQVLFEENKKLKEEREENLQTLKQKFEDYQDISFAPSWNNAMDTCVQEIDKKIGELIKSDKQQ